MFCANTIPGYGKETVRSFRIPPSCWKSPGPRIPIDDISILHNASGDQLNSVLVIQLLSIPLLLLYCTKDFDQDTVLCRCDWTTPTLCCMANLQPTSMSTGCAELTGQSTLPSCTVSQCNRITSAAVCRRISYKVAYSSSTRPEQPVLRPTCLT